MPTAIAAARHANFKHVLRGVDLCRNECFRVAGQHCRIGPTTVQKLRRKDANINPHCKRREDQIPRLREEAGDCDSRCHAHDGGEQSKTCLVQRLTPGCRLGKSFNGKRSCRRSFKLRPKKAREQCQDCSQPNADGEAPGADGNVRYSERLLCYCRDHGNASPNFPMLRQLRSILVNRHSD